MILDTMTCQEMSRYLEPVRERIMQYSLSIGKKATRKVKNNTWLILNTRHLEYQNDHFYFVTKAKKYKKGGNEGLEIVCMPYCLITRRNGSRYVLQFELNNIRVFRTYEMHLFQRYKERFLKDETLDLMEVIHKFFRNNCTPSVITEENMGYASIINDGIILSNEKFDFSSNITMQRYKTFLTQEMLFDDQSSLKKEGICKETLDYLIDLFDNGGPEYIKKAHYVMNVSIDSLQKS